MSEPYIVALREDQPLQIEIAAGTDYPLPLVNPAFGDHEAYDFMCQVRDAAGELMFSASADIQLTEFTDPTETGLTVTFTRANTALLTPGTVYYFDILASDGQLETTYLPVSEIAVARKITNPDDEP